MESETMELYKSENGDRWLLARDAASGRVFIRHIPNVPSGGKSARLELGHSYVSEATDLSTWSCCGSSEHWSRSVLILDITKPWRPNCQSDRVEVQIPIDRYDKSVQNRFIWQGLRLGDELGNSVDSASPDAPLRTAGS